MANILKLRRGTSAEHAAFTGANCEVTVDTTKKTLVVHDGLTVGGSALATEANANLRVRVDTDAQGLSTSQQANARKNINVAKAPLVFALNADLNLVNSASPQSLFGVGTPVLPAGRYRYRITSTHSKGSGTGAIQFGFGGTATIAQHTFKTKTRLGALGTTIAPINAVAGSLGGAGLVTVSGNTEPSSVNLLEAEGIIDISLAGTLIPQIAWTVAPGLAKNLKGSFIELWDIGATGSDTNIGGWAA